MLMYTYAFEYLRKGLFVHVDHRLTLVLLLFKIFILCTNVFQFDVPCKCMSVKCLRAKSREREPR